MKNFFSSGKKAADTNGSNGYHQHQNGSNSMNGTNGLNRINGNGISRITITNGNNGVNGNSESNGQEMRFKGKVALVTGSSSGIGQSTILMMAKEGAYVTVHGETKKHIEETIDMLKKAGVTYDRFHWIQGSLDKEETRRRLIDETINKFGRLDVLVCNAAATSIPGDPDFYSMKVLRYVMEVNVVSTIDLVQQSIKHLAKTKGNIVLVSTALSNRTAFMGQFYGASKAAMDHYARSAGMMYGPLGIRINSVRVGATQTRIYDRIGKYNLTDRHVSQCVKNTALGREAQPQEIAEFILFLASEKASYLTCGVLDADGGLCSNFIQAPDDILEQFATLEPQSHGIPM